MPETWVCDRCGARIEGFPFWADEICSDCKHVPLCGLCLTLHRTEVAADVAREQRDALAIGAQPPCGDGRCYCGGCVL